MWLFHLDEFLLFGILKWHKNFFKVAKLLMFFREKIQFTNNTNQNFFIVKYEDMPEYMYGIVKNIFIRY